MYKTARLLKILVSYTPSLSQLTRLHRNMRTSGMGTTTMDITKPVSTEERKVDVLSPCKVSVARELLFGLLQ